MIKDQFSTHLNEMSNRVFDFSEDLLTKIAGHDSVFMVGQRVAAHSPDTDVLERFHCVTKQIQQSIDEQSSERQVELKKVHLIKGTSEGYHTFFSKEGNDMILLPCMIIR